MKTISRGRMFAVTFEVSDARLKALKQTPEILQAALQAGADYWHTGILPDHFKADAHSKYGYAVRATKYIKTRQKGSKPDLIFSGSLRRDLRARAIFKATRNSVSLTMSARVLNFVPRMPENSDEVRIKHKNGVGYPNLKRELKAVTDEDRESIAVVVVKDLERAYAPTDEKREALQ